VRKRKSGLRACWATATNLLFQSLANLILGFGSLDEVLAVARMGDALGGLLLVVLVVAQALVVSLPAVSVIRVF
jgi:hypothetical protein